MTGIVRRFSRRRNMSSSRIHSFYIIIGTEFKGKHILEQDELFCCAIISSGLKEKLFYVTKTRECRKKSFSFFLPWEFQTPISSSEAPGSSLLLGDPGLLINLSKNWLSQCDLAKGMGSLQWVREKRGNEDNKGSTPSRLPTAVGTVVHPFPFHEASFSEIVCKSWTEWTSQEACVDLSSARLCLEQKLCPVSCLTSFDHISVQYSNLQTPGSACLLLKASSGQRVLPYQSTQHRAAWDDCPLGGFISQQLAAVAT